MRAWSGVIVVVLLAGCTQNVTLQPAQGPDNTSASFQVPGLHVGDDFQYGFGFKSGPASFQGLTNLKILDRGPVVDAWGRTRDAIHVRQGQSNGQFTED